MFSHPRFIAALPTPLTEGRKFDPKGMEKLLDFVLSDTVSNKVEGILILGSIGEGPCFSFQERTEIILRVVQYVDGKVKVIVGVGGNTINQTLPYLRQAEECGTDIILLSPPFWRKHWIAESEMTQYYHKILHASAVPVLLYNIPVDGWALPPSVFQQLTSIPHFLGVKDSSGDISVFSSFAKMGNAFQGDERLVLEGFAQGGVGIVSGLASIFPAKVSRLYSLVLSGRKKEAQQAQEEITSLLSWLCSFQNPLAVEKYFLSRKGICHPYVHLPYRALSEEEKAKIDNYFGFAHLPL